MQRADKEITSRAEIDAIINKAQVLRLALAVESEPYVVPVSFGYDGSSLYFHTAQTGKKLDMLSVNNRVCFEVEGNVSLKRHAQEACKWSFLYTSVIGAGVVIELKGEDEKIQGLNAIMRHYSGADWSFKAEALKNTRVWRVAVESLTGKRSGEKMA
ncbi:pyridoxamine 5'-phosphate oxidase family protein [Oligoflexia bacterium]|nr:pyridoxamine 5'-phosphate oxidase family protein [Oligoflexia bacterium]